jgi:hypothetical protein
MKASIKTFLALIITFVFLFSGCKKFEDGPLLSLRTKKSRISGNWKIGSATYNGNDQTELYQGIISEWEIKSSGSYSIKSISGASDNGTWEFGEDKDDVYFKSDSPANPEQSFRILRLKHKDVWLRQILTNGSVVELHLK